MSYILEKMRANSCWLPITETRLCSTESYLLKFSSPVVIGDACIKFNSSVMMSRRLYCRIR